MEKNNRESMDVLELIELTKNKLVKEYPNITGEIIDELIEKSIIENSDFLSNSSLFQEKTIALLKKVLKDNNYIPSSKKFSSVDIYLKEIDRDLLSKEEEKELLIKASNGDIESRNKLVEKNQRLVYLIAKKYIIPPIMLSDLIQEGNIGLMRAIDRFDVSKGFRFSTYAYICIIQAILRYIQINRYSVKLPYGMQDKILKYNKEHNSFCNTHDRKPTTEEMASILNISIEKTREIKDAICFSVPVSLNEHLSDESDDELESILSDDSVSVEDVSLKKDRKHEVDMLLNNSGLTDKEKTIIIKRFGLDGNKPSTLSDIASILNCSRERVRQQESKILQKLRNSKYIVGLCEYMEHPDECKKKVAPQPEKSKIILKQPILSIYDSLSKYSKEDIDSVLLGLTEDEKDIISLKYNSIVYRQQHDKKFALPEKRTLTTIILPKIKKELEKIKEEKEAKQRRQKLIAKAQQKRLKNEQLKQEEKDSNYDINMIRTVIDRVKSKYKDFLKYIKSSYFKILKEELKDIPLNSLEINPNIYLMTVAENVVVRELCKKCKEGNIDLEIAMVEKYRDLTNFIIRKKEIGDKAKADDVIISAISSYDGKCSFSLHISEILKKYNQKQKILK